MYLSILNCFFLISRLLLENYIICVIVIGDKNENEIIKDMFSEDKLSSEE